jgi:hypothetical protein
MLGNVDSAILFKKFSHKISKPAEKVEYYDALCR